MRYSLPFRKDTTMSSEKCLISKDCPSFTTMLMKKLLKECPNTTIVQRKPENNRGLRPHF